MFFLGGVGVEGFRVRGCAKTVVLGYLGRNRKP